MIAIGYIRQSRRADLDVALSPEAQRAAIARLASADGVDPASVLLFSDLGRSGATGKERFRAGYLEAVRLMEAGAVGTCYAISLTRLARSVRELARLADIAEKHRIRLVFDKEGVYDPADPARKAFFGMASVFSEFERDLSVQRARDNIAVRRSRGDRMGRLPYGDKPGEDPALVLAAYLEGKSFHAAARILNAASVPSSLGRQWSRSAVSHVLERRYPDALPERTPVGRRERPPFVLFHLVRCSCKTLLTGSRQRWRVGSPWAVIYRCHKAEQSEHPSPTMVPEARVLDFVKAEVARLVLPDVVEMAASAEDAASLQAEREHVLYQHQHGWVKDLEAEAAMTEIEARADALRATEAAVAIPAIDWTWAPAALNKVLTALLVEVTMDERMQPVEAVWRNRALRGGAS
jgi:DNA invertase Pin-like site-specific DNA recombinase